MTNMLSITGLSKRYNDGKVALENVSFDVQEGEILALLGPNGAGKTTLISAVCGLVVPTAGQVTVGGFDTRSNYRLARSLIGLVPQEIALEPFEKVINTVRFSRGLFGKSPNDDQIEIVLRQLSLWDKKDSKNFAVVRRYEKTRADCQSFGRTSQEYYSSTNHLQV